ncbi:thioesterase II family protein [Amycolatopsis sp. cg5]|uniref:thioesterase II family protein n=1 Tax=Amycolatopsis sp. cg5 TaxID=3238802 RepID=UPI003523F801
MSSENSAWIRNFHGAPDPHTRLVCFPHAGGAATYYYGLSASLTPSVEVLGVQYPGRQDRRAEPCLDDVGDLADAITPELLERTDRPIALFGHSLGATIAFEVAIRLEKAGVTPVVLFASGRRAPSTFRDENVWQADDDAIIASLKAMSGATAAMLDDEILRMILPAVRADYKAAETYRYQPGPRLHCPIVALTGDDDPQVTLDEAGAWGEHTESEFELKVFYGGHFYLDFHTEAVLDTITTTLWEVTDGAGEPAGHQ